jgi:murein DD-endopeptidase MepM/ murein hydrolase activator NlpD
VKTTHLGVISFRVLLAIIAIAWSATSSRTEVATSFRFPLDVSWTVTGPFDKWNKDWFGYHVAEDVLVAAVNNPPMTELPVYAAGTGKVIHAKPHTGYGWVVIIEHQLSVGDSYAPLVQTLYGHLRRDGIASVGTSVRKGDLIGYLSSKMAENGGYPFTHLHFAIRRGAAVDDSCHPDTNWWRYAGGSTLLTRQKPNLMTQKQPQKIKKEYL